MDILFKLSWRSSFEEAYSYPASKALMFDSITSSEYFAYLLLISFLNCSLIGICEIRPAISPIETIFFAFAEATSFAMVVIGT